MGNKIPRLPKFQYGSKVVPKNIDIDGRSYITVIHGVFNKKVQNFVYSFGEIKTRITEGILDSYIER